jgi:hypothetical protein
MAYRNGVFKINNDYRLLISQQVYEKTPKAVFAALVVSYLLNHQNIKAKDIDKNIREEWANLNAQGIVPQKPRI